MRTINLFEFEEIHKIVNARELLEYSSAKCLLEDSELLSL